jgi:Ca2+-binding EF-hand superfamily protein
MSEKVFNLADKNSDGLLDLQEMKEFVRNTDQAGAALETIDTSGDGLIDIEEWCESIYGTWEKSERGAEMILEIREKAVLKRRAEREAAEAASGAGADEPAAEAAEAAPAKEGKLVLPRNDFGRYAGE